MDTRGPSHHNDKKRTRTTSPPQEFRDDFGQIEHAFEQQHDCDCCKVTEADALLQADATTGDQRGTIGPDAPNSSSPDPYSTSFLNNTGPEHSCLQHEQLGPSVLRSHVDDPSCDISVEEAPLKSADAFDPGKERPMRRDFHTPRFTWMNATIILICSLSTALSALFVVLALKGQRYGSFIGNESDSKMRISTAILWTSVIAKWIELTFVTAFVAFLGQVISRKAFAQSNRHGVTLSEMTMWRWIVQPGTLFTQSEIARYAGFSFLGVLTIFSTVLSTLYVTAATALVQPIPRESEWYSKVMTGSVKADFASIKHIQDSCKLPIAPGIDDLYLSSTCMQISHAARSMYNEQTFLADWKDFSQSGGTLDQEQRPAVVGLQYANSTIVPQWINVINTTEVSKQHQRVVNNVTLALPHIGVVDAVHDQRNKMPQSESSNSIGPYSLWASVPSPMINVMCVTMTKTELEPIVFSSWPSNETVNGSNWFTTGNMTTWNASHIMGSATTTNQTAVDELFGWNKEDTETMLDYPPVFPLFPKPFNTVLNHTSFAWGRPAIYVLGQGAGPDVSYHGPDLREQYPVCRIKAGISTACSTRYSVSVAGSKVEVLCGDRAVDMAYAETNKSATTISSHPNWRDLGADWASSLSLHTGISDGYASNNRLLMQLMLAPGEDDRVELNPELPSLAEVLASLASDTLVLSSKDAPFVEYFASLLLARRPPLFANNPQNYTLPPNSTSLTNPAQQWFQAKLTSQEYSSGGANRASKAWLAILLSTFLLNSLMLLYFTLQPGLITDISSPPHLFSLALNSPPPHSFRETQGFCPSGDQYKVKWSVDREDEHYFLYQTPRATPPG